MALANDYHVCVICVANQPGKGLHGRGDSYCGSKGVVCLASSLATSSPHIETSLMVQSTQGPCLESLRETEM